MLSLPNINLQRNKPQFNSSYISPSNDEVQAVTKTELESAKMNSISRMLSRYWNRWWSLEGSNAIKHVLIISNLASELKNKT